MFEAPGRRRRWFEARHKVCSKLLDDGDDSLRLGQIRSILLATTIVFSSKLLDDGDDFQLPNQMFVLKLFDDDNGSSRPKFSAIIANAGAGMVVATVDRPDCSSGEQRQRSKPERKGDNYQV